MAIITRYPLPSALPVVVAAPANELDATMFAGGVFPAVGVYLAGVPGALWIYSGGQPNWQVAPAAQP